MPNQVTSNLIVWQITPPKVYAGVRLRLPGILPVEGFEFADDNNAVIAWNTDSGQLDTWLLDVKSQKVPPTLPHAWGESSHVAYNPALNALLVKLEDPQPCGWNQVSVRGGKVISRTVNISDPESLGDPGNAISDDGTLFAETSYDQLPTTSVWSVASRRQVSSWRQDAQEQGDLTFFDGSRGIAEVIGGPVRDVQETTIDMLRVRDHTIVGHYTLPPVPNGDLSTSLTAIGGFLMVAQYVGEKTTNQGEARKYAYYVLPLPVLK